MGWYITILQEMRDELGLKGNELIVYAFINGYSQGGHGCYHGSLATLQAVCGIASRHTAIDTLKSLVDKGLITKSEMNFSGVKYISYSVCAKIAGGVQKLHKGSAENAPNNNSDININNTLSNKGRTRFQKPSLEEIRAYCNERGNSVDPVKFFNFYESKGWMVGKSPMKDWKASVRTWEQRPDEKKTTRQPQQKESVFARNLKVMDEMYGTNMYEEAYGKKEVCDEQ